MRAFWGFTRHIQPRARAVNSRAYSVALIGLGYRGYRSHFLSLVGSPSVSIIAVCDTNRTSVDSFSANHRDIPAYPSLSRLLLSHKPDFAIVSVPHGSHMECIMALSAKGVPVLKEKPVAESVDDYLQMSRLPIKIGVTFQKRFEPHILHFKSLLPLVGETAAIEANLALNITNLEETWRAASGVGVTEDLGCHMLDLIVWLFGMPTSLMAHGVSSVRPFQTYSGDDVSDVIMNWTPRNCIGHTRMSRVAHKAAQSITVTGANGTLVLDGHQISQYDPQGRQTLEVKHQPAEKLVIRSMVHQFGDWVAGRRADFLTSLENVQDAVIVVDAIKTSLANHRVQHPLLLSSKTMSFLDNRQLSWRPSLNSGSIAKYSTLSHSVNTKSNSAFSLNTGASIPTLGLGTRRAEWPGQVYEAVRVALQTGYRLIDTAQSSGNEHEIGKAIKDSGVPRERIWITTKLDNKWHTRVGEAMESSLKALGIEYIDLYLMHWPISVNPHNPAKQLVSWNFLNTWQEMQELPTDKVQNIGVSNFGVRHLETLLSNPACKVIPAINQIELHPYWPSRKLLEYCNMHHIHCTAYSCLGSFGSPLLEDPVVLDISREKRKSQQQILIMWGVQRGTSVVPKTVNASRVRENFDLDGWGLTDDEVDRLNKCEIRSKSCRDDWLPGRVFFGDED